MRFETIHVSREDRYALARDRETGEPVFSIPVQNLKVEYEEYYRLSEQELEFLRADPASARHFARQCGERMHDLRLVLKPGLDRGF
jgi:hypothetical protein